MKSETICLVDDDIIYQFTARKILSGIEAVKDILIFSDGEQAYNYLLNHKDQENDLPGLIFLDINMPFMNGWTFLETFKLVKPKLSKHITIYMVSSSVEQSDMERARGFAEVSGYILKPITKAIFQAKIDDLLKN